MVVFGCQNYFEDVFPKLQRLCQRGGMSGLLLGKTELCSLAAEETFEEGKNQSMYHIGILILASTAICKKPQAIILKRELKRFQ